MSQLNGILQLNGRPPADESFTRMMATAEASCPDGSGIWRGDSIALGFSLLQTLPPYRSASAPFRDAEAGLVIVADARIDNRLELAGQLDINEYQQRNDAEFILRAYGKWGEACVEHLLGDFAFAIWDERSHTLFCARDSFGVRPFYYSLSSHRFIFSSTILSLLQSGELSRELNEEYIADSLAGLTLAGDATVYKEIAALPAAHSLTIREGRLLLRCNWQPDITRRIVFRREEEYVERYRELFTEAVRCRLESNGNVASLLSGGLDSGSIAAVAGKLLTARNKRLSTFSFVLADNEREFNEDEKQLITLLHDMEGVGGSFISSEDFVEEPLHRYYDSCTHLPLGNSPYLATVLGNLRTQNTRILLDGFGGDACATCASTPMLHDFLSGFQLSRLLGYIRAASGSSGASMVRTIKSLLSTLIEKDNSHTMSDIVLNRSVLAERFSDRIQVMERARKSLRFMLTKSRSLRGIMQQNLLLSGKCSSLSEQFKLAQVELSQPMLDRRLVDFCLAVPIEQHNFDMNRRLIRRAMRGLLPDEVRLRHNKNISNMPGVIDVIFSHRSFFLDVIERSQQNCLAYDFIDIEKLKNRFTESLPKAVNSVGKSAFIPGPTMRGFIMLQFLMNHAMTCDK